MKNKLWFGINAILLAGLILAACGPTATPTPDKPANTNAVPAAAPTAVPAAVTAVPTTAAPTAEAAKPAGKVQVTVLGTLKSEIATQFEAAMLAYNASQDKYEVVSIPLEGNAPEKMSALYASGNPPTIMGMGQEFPMFQKNLLDLSNVEFSKHALPGTQDFVTVDGKIYGMPLTVESFGLLYNKSVLDKAAGGTFDPQSIKTQSDLKSIMDKIVTSGASGIHISPMDWSLGAHLTNIMFTTQSEKHADRVQFMADLKAGKVSLLTNKQFNGWMDTLDLIKQYNQNKASPLSPTYDNGTLALSSGKTGLWFMGNWAFPQLNEANSKNEYGIMPYPISNEATTYGNTQISVGVPFYMVIDASKSTNEQQAGAVDFLNWLVNSNEGQDFYVNQFKFIPVFDTIKTQPSNLMSQQILKYAQDNKSLEWMNSLYPADGWATMGVSMQKYLDGKIDRKGLAKEIEDYWKKVK
jgi:raffinose/stachyose/melibiose transport system substrate-binding protein